MCVGSKRNDAVKVFCACLQIAQLSFLPRVQRQNHFFVSPFDMISIWDNVKSNILTGQYFYEENISYFKWEKCVLLRVSEFWSTFKYPIWRTIAPIDYGSNEVWPNLGSFGPQKKSHSSKNCLFSSFTSKFRVNSAAQPFGANCSALSRLSKVVFTAF